MHKLKLTIDRYDEGVADASYLTPWLDAASKRKLQHLHVRSYSYGDRRFHKMPARLYNCETLVCLKLFQVTLDDAEFVCLPCLKTMCLEYTEFHNEATFETLVLCCPALEDLNVVVAHDDAKVFRVHSKSLKRLTLERFSSLPASFVFDSSPGFVIDAPRLCFLSINDNTSQSLTVNNLDPNAEFDMSLPFEWGYPDTDEEDIPWGISKIRGLLPGISIVRDMTISRDSFKLIHQYSMLENLPLFGYMSRLHITLPMSLLEWIPTFLESCPKLKSLVLVCDVTSKYYDEESGQTSFSSVPAPQCLLSSLEFVYFDGPIPGYVGHVDEMELFKYFLMNSAVLKKLSLRLDCSYDNKRFEAPSVIRDEFYKILVKIPRGSPKCKCKVVVIL